MSEPPPERQLSWFPIAAAAAVVALIVVLTFALGGGSNRGVDEVSKVDGSGALECPTTKPRLDVPTKPHGVSTGKHLAPDAAVKHLVVCEYVYDGTLHRRVVVRSGLAAARTELATQVVTPTSGSASASAHLCSNQGDQFLIGAVYEKGYVWIDVIRGPCARTTNGTASTDSAALATAAGAAYATGVWPS